jgi:hypothetical protein
MISRSILCVVMAGVGLNGLFPEPPKPLTAERLQAYSKQKSVSNLCQKKKKSKAVKELCKKWGETNA